MGRTIKIILMLLILLWASSEAAFSKDPLKIDGGALEINNITAKSSRSAVVFNGIGDLAELIGPESDAILKEHLGVMDGYVPIKGFASVGDKVYGLIRKELVMSRKGFFFIRITCTVHNTSESAQTFRVGDIGLKDIDRQINFFAAGPNSLAYRVHDKEDYLKMAPVAYNLEPNASKRFSYIFIADSTKKPWVLSYKEDTSTELEIE